MGAPRQRRQRGQALLIVLVFIAAFLLIIWAALSLASGALLNQNSVRADTRDTYALDAGIAYGMAAVDAKHGNGCNAPGNSNFTLNYPSGAITVTVTIAKGNPCHGAGATFTVTAAASGTSRKLVAQMTQGPNAMAIDWEAFQ